MLFEVLILAFAAQSLAAFDDANLALTKCGFAAFRHANERDQTQGQFERILASQCSAQFAELRRAVISLETGRGKRKDVAQANADALIAQFRARFADNYAKRAESEAQIRALERALRDEGKSNAQ